MSSISETRGQVDLSQLIPAFTDTMRYFDSKYEGIISDVMAGPRPTPKNRIGFRYPIIVGTGAMAPVASESDPAVYMETASYMESFTTRIYKVGWKLEPNQWDAEIGAGKMGTMLSFKIEEQSKALDRREEYEGLAYLFGDTTTINRYSTQDQGRLREWDVTSDSLGLTGNSWGTITGDSNLPDILFDLDRIIYNAKLIGDKPKSKFLVGPKTFFVMQRNINLKNDIKNVVDVRGNIVGSTLRGLNMKEVIFNRYKEVSGWSGMMGGPGLGSLMWDKWTDMKSQHMMRHTDGETTYEFGLITADEVGTRWKAPVFTSERYPKGDDVTHSFWEDDPLLLKSWRAKRRGYSIDDFADVHVVKKIVSIDANGF